MKKGHTNRFLFPERGEKKKNNPSRKSSKIVLA